MKINKEQFVHNLVTTLVSTMMDKDLFNAAVIEIRESKQIGEEMKRSVFQKFYEIVTNAVKSVEEGDA